MSLFIHGDSEFGAMNTLTVFIKVDIQVLNILYFVK